jgi:CheY-like chemotaxis protein
MVRLMSELHGGTTAVESAVGEGSQFTVWLPLRDAEASEERVANLTTYRSVAPLAAPVALVVEDDLKSAYLVRLQLEAAGFKVLHCLTAEEALTVAPQQPLSLITLDIMLPGVDGWELLSRLKSSPGLARVPVVIISIVADRNKGFALGASAVMQKPISRQELYESLVELDLFPVIQGQSLKVLVVDDDPKAVELVALRMMDMASTVIRAYGGQEAIEAARRELIVLDLMMPEVNGFDVIEALNEHTYTARIPVLIVTAKEISQDERTQLSGYVTAIMEKGAFDGERFTAEVRRAMVGRKMVG